MLFLQIKNIYVNFSNYDLGHYIQSTEYEKKKKHEVQFSINQLLMDEIKKKRKEFQL